MVRRWQKGADEPGLDNLILNLADNKEITNSLSKKTNAIYDEISAVFPSLDRITAGDDKFNAWRNAVPKNLEKLIEREDQRVTGTGRVSDEGYELL